LIKEFKYIRAKEENIKVKLVGFKKAYNLDNTDDGQHVKMAAKKTKGEN